MSSHSNSSSARTGFQPSAHLVVAIISALLAAAMWLLVPYQVDKPMAMFGFGAKGLDPKVFPYLVTAIWFFVSVWNIVEAFRQHEDDGATLRGSMSGSVIVTVLASFAYAFALESLGFVISSGLVVAGLSIYFGAREWLPILICAVGVPGLIFFVFTGYLHVSLPPVPAWIPGV